MNSTMVKTPNSAVYRGIDPAEIMERDETLQQFGVAKAIFKLPEVQWESRIQLLPPDRRTVVRMYLGLLKEHCPCRR